MRIYCYQCEAWTGEHECDCSQCAGLADTDKFEPEEDVKYI